MGIFQLFSVLYIYFLEKLKFKIYIPEHRTVLLVSIPLWVSGFKMFIGFKRSQILAYKKTFADALMRGLQEAGMKNSYWVPCYNRTKLNNAQQSTFWSDCKDKGPTVTIVRYQEYIFAAFSDRKWGDEGKNNNNYEL